LLSNDDALIQAVDRVEKLGGWEEKDIAALHRISQLRRRMSISIEVVEKTAHGTTYSPVIVLKARAGTPELAQGLVQAWAEVCEELSRGMYSKGKTGMKDFVGAKFDTAQAELLDVVEKIRDLEISFNADLEEVRMLEKHNRLLSHESSLAEVDIDIGTRKAEIESIRADFEKEPEKKTLWRSPPMNAVFMREVTDEISDGGKERGAGTGGIPEAARLNGYSEEVFNGAWEELKGRFLEKQTDLTMLLKRKELLEGAIVEAEQEYQEARELVARRIFERKQLEMKELPLRASYDLLATKVEQTKIVESEEENLGDIRIVAAAVLPDKKIKPRRSLIVLVAMLAGFALACGAVLLQDVLSDDQVSVSS